MSSYVTHLNLDAPMGRTATAESSRRQGRWYAVASQATLAGRGLMLLLFGRFCGDRLNSFIALPRKIKQALARR